MSCRGEGGEEEEERDSLGVLGSEIGHSQAAPVVFRTHTLSWQQKKETCR